MENSSKDVVNEQKNVSKIVQVQVAGKVNAKTFIAHQEVNIHEKPKNSTDKQKPKDSTALTDTIFMLHNEPISKYKNVYKGVQIHGKFGKVNIAIKTIYHSEEYEREAEILVKLCPHPNVANIIQSGVCNLGPFKHIFIAMEFCGPQNLTDFIKGSNRTKKIKQSLVKQIICAIAHIHNQNIIHRDLKPDNVLVSDDGKQLKVIDFGLSKELNKGRSATHQSTLRVGTDGWRAPETYNDNVISKYADIFSTALVIYFILTDGLHPFGNDPDEWNLNIKRHQRCNIVALESEMQDLVGWMLKFDPRERPSAEQILEHKCLGGDLVSPSLSQTTGGLRIIHQQPQNGEMSDTWVEDTLPGYEEWGTRIITYSFPAGSLVGVSYEAQIFTEYLPKGYQLHDLLKQAFDAGLVFKIKEVDNGKGEIIWNTEIPHKVNKTGGIMNNGYPDAYHLEKLRAALEAKGFVWRSSS